jgi:hypothetical protein
VRVVSLRRQEAAPRVEQHHGIDTRADLLVEVRGDGARVHFDETLQQVGALVDHPADGREVRAPRAFDHVARERERTACEPDQGHAPAKCALDFGDGVEHIPQLRHVRDLQGRNRALVGGAALEAWAFSLGEMEAKAHRVGHRQDVENRSPHPVESARAAAA